MANGDTDNTRNDEFTRIFDEYRAKIDEITRKTEFNLQQNGVATEKTDTETAHYPETEDHTETAEIEHTEEPQPEKEYNTERKKPVVIISDVQSEKVIKEAKREAQRIIIEAEERVKKEAKKKTQAQVDKIIERARKEAEDTVARSKQEAEKERNEIIATSKRDAEKLLEDLTEKYRQETQAQFSRVITEAREKATSLISDVVESSTEISQLVTEIVNRTRNTIQEFENRLQAETGDLTMAISEIQQKLEQVTMTAQKEEKPEIEPVNKNKIPVDSPALSVRFLGEKFNGRNGSNPLYSGQVEMRSISSSFDYQYLKALKKHLVRNHSIKYLQECASEKETSIVFDLKEPLPIIDILHTVPLVDEVRTEADEVCVIFKNPPE